MTQLTNGCTVVNLLLLLSLGMLLLSQTIVAETYRLQTLAGYKGNGQDFDRTFNTKHAFLNTPCGICFGNNDEIYVSDCVRSLIFKIFPNETMIIFGGLGSGGFNQDGYHVKQTLFNSPTSLSMASNGDLYVADSNNDLIRIVSAETGLVSSLPFTFNKPLGVHVSVNNFVYIADSGNNVIKKYDISNRILTTIAGGNGYLDGTFDNVDANSIILKTPKNIHVVSNGKDDTIYFTDEERVKSIDKDGKYRIIEITELKSNLNGIFVTKNNEIWTSSATSHYLQMNSLSGGSSGSLIIGQKDSFGYEGDNLVDSYSNVRFFQPGSIIVKGSIIYLVDTNNNCIRKIDHSNRKVSTFSGGLINHPFGENIPKFEISPVNTLSKPFIYKNELYFSEKQTILRKISNIDNNVKTIFGSNSNLQTQTSPTRIYTEIKEMFCFPNGDVVMVGSSSLLHVLNLETQTVRKVQLGEISVQVQSMVGIGDSFENGTMYVIYGGYGSILHKYQNGTLQNSTSIIYSPNELSVIENEVYFLNGVLSKVEWGSASIEFGFPLGENLLHAAYDSKNGKVYLAGEVRIYEANLENLTLKKIGGLDSVVVDGNPYNIYGYGGEKVNANQSALTISSIMVNDGIIYVGTASSYIFTIVDGIVETIVGSSPMSKSLGVSLYTFCRDPKEQVIYMLDNNVLKKYDQRTGEMTSVMISAKTKVASDYVKIPDSIFVISSKPTTKMIFSPYDNMIYVSDSCRITQINPKTMKTQRVAGKSCGNVIPDIPALESPLYTGGIMGFSANPLNGDIYLCYANFIGKLEKSSGMIRVLYWNNYGGFDAKDGIVEKDTPLAKFGYVQSVSDDIHYFYASNRIRVLEKLSNGSFSLTTLIGTGVSGYSGDNLPALSTQITGSDSFYVKQNGDIIVTDQDNYIIRKYIKKTGLLTTIAGQPRKNSLFFFGDTNGKDTSLYGFSNSIDFDEKTEETVFMDTGSSFGFSVLIRKLSPYCEGVSQFNPTNKTCDCLDGYYGEKCEAITCNGTISFDSKTCNGNGKCTGLDVCMCNNRFEGQFCERSLDNLSNTEATTILVVSIVIPIVGVALIALIVIVIIIVILVSMKRRKNTARHEIATATIVEMSEFPSNSKVFTSSLGSNVSDNEDVLSRYINMTKIGQGAFGSVFKCTDTKCSNKVKAIKIVKFESFTDLNTIMKEASQLSNIKHANILKVNDYFITSDNLLCIDMDYYENGDLTKFTKKEQCSELIIRKIMKQVLNALNYVHSELSIIHRDIKPSNIFIRNYSGKDVEVVLADFGLAKKYQEMKGQSYAGTPLFMSPEIALGSSYSFNTDIFSLGVSIYQIITHDESTSISNLLMGNQSSNAEKILTQQMKESNDEYSNELIEIVLKMLDRNQESRPNAKQLLSMPYFNK